MSIRIGHGYDVHKFGGKGPIVIAGVSIDHAMGLIAHSDGDVLLHALCDAMLGALALGDIGRHFPDTDPALREKIAKQGQELGQDVMHQRLAKLDPAAAAAIPKENLRRVVRALEVIELTGKPFTANLPRQESSKYPNAKQFGLVLDRSNLDEKIECLIKNVQWYNNPNKFTHKLTDDANEKETTINEVKEFGIYNASKYIRSTVNIDRSSEGITNLTTQKDPIFTNETLFLNVILEGKATLFFFKEDIVEKYFYKKENSTIEQLINKNYLTPNNADGTSLVGTFLFPATFTIYEPLTDKNGWC